MKLLVTLFVQDRPPKRLFFDEPSKEYMSKIFFDGQMVCIAKNIPMIFPSLGQHVVIPPALLAQTIIVVEEYPSPESSNEKT